MADIRLLCCSHGLQLGHYAGIILSIIDNRWWPRPIIDSGRYLIERERSNCVADMGCICLYIATFHIELGHVHVSTIYMLYVAYFILHVHVYDNLLASQDVFIAIFSLQSRTLCRFLKHA